jgi:hypothetical protein
VRRASLVALGCVLIAGCGSSGPAATNPPSSAHSSPSTHAHPGTHSHPSAIANSASVPAATHLAPGANSAAPATRPAPRTPPPGSLPQTSGLPSADGPRFHAEMAALWNGIRTNSVTAAMPAFCPEGAYLQLKRIGDPRGDFIDRLVREFGLDIAAAHQLLGGALGSAQLVSVNVPGSFAHWVPPGVTTGSGTTRYRTHGWSTAWGAGSALSGSPR